jgi:hypothetical protein
VSDSEVFLDKQTVLIYSGKYMMTEYFAILLPESTRQPVSTVLEEISSIS